MPRLRLAQDDRGFTLLEMSIVLVIIATVIAGGTVMFSQSLQKRQLQETQMKIAAIQKALLDYRIANNRLPCPADVTQAMGTVTANNNYFGLEASTAGDCYSTGTIKANFQKLVSSTGTTAYASVTGDTFTSSVIKNISPGTTGISSGMTVSGSGIPTGDTVSSVDGPSQVTITPTPDTATATGVSLTFTSTKVTGIGSTTGMAAYQSITDTGIPYGDTIASVDSSSQVTMATAATAAGTATVTTLDNVEGMVPTKTLQLPDDYAIDGWGRRIMYAVDARFTASNAFPTVNPLVDGAGVPAGCTAPCTPNAATRMTVDDGTLPTPAAKTTAAAYVVISFGPNGHGAWPRGSGTTSVTTRISSGSINADEQKNCDCNSSAAAQSTNGIFGVFVQKLPTQDPATANHTNDFDDIVAYATRKDLFSPTESGAP